MLFFLYIVNFLDRVNISYAIDAGMFQYLGVSAKEVGIIASLASSLFFVGYFIPQIFSNLGINRYGVRKIFLIAFLAWGIITIATGFVTSVSQVYVLRFLLGIAEGPFFAGVMFYLSLWFLKPERATANSFFTAAIPISGIFGSLIAGAIFATYGNYPGWRYLFWYEGMLAIFGGLLAYFILTDFPSDAKWLSNDERSALEQAFKEEEVEKVKVSWTKALADLNVILLAIVYFLGVTSLYGYSIWLPSIISFIGKVNATIASFLSIVPYVIASISLILIARYADRRQNHRFVTFAVFLVAGIGLALSAATQSIYFIIHAFRNSCYRDLQLHCNVLGGTSRLFIWRCSCSCYRFDKRYWKSWRNCRSYSSGISKIIHWIICRWNLRHGAILNFSWCSNIAYQEELSYSILFAFSLPSSSFCL